MDNMAPSPDVPPVPPTRTLRECWILVGKVWLALSPLALFVTHRFIFVPFAAVLWISVWRLEKKPGK